MLAADVPDLEIHVREGDGGDVLADGGDGGAGGGGGVVVEGFDGGEEGRFAGVVEAQEQDGVLCRRVLEGGERVGMVGGWGEEVREGGTGECGGGVDMGDWRGHAFFRCGPKV